MDKINEVSEITPCSNSGNFKRQADDNITNQPWVPYKKRKTITEYEVGGSSCDIPYIFSNWLFTDYAEDIYKVLLEREKSRLIFYDQSPQAQYRPQFIKFMRNVAVMEQLSRTTVHLGVYILDVFMDNHQITYERLSLVTLVSLMLASKLEDREQRVPKLIALNAIVNNQYPISDFQALEKIILRFFDFRLIIPTAATFLEYFIEGIVCNADYEDLTNQRRFSSFVAMKHYVSSIALEFVDLTLQNQYMLQEIPSKMASACLAAARRTACLTNIWPDSLIELTNYKVGDLENCLNSLIYARSKMVNMHCNQLNHNTPESSGYLSARDCDEEFDDVDDEDEDEEEDDDDDYDEDADDDIGLDGEDADDYYKIANSTDNGQC